MTYRDDRLAGKARVGTMGASLWDDNKTLKSVGALCAARSWAECVRMDAQQVRHLPLTAKQSKKKKSYGKNVSVCQVAANEENERLSGECEQIGWAQYA